MEDLAGRTIGGYQIIEQIGKGGMAAVFRAYQPSLDRDVAIKVLPPYYAQQDESFLQRFKREARAIAKLRHPNILMVMDFGEDDNLAYIVMEYIPTGTLKEHMRRTMTLGEIYPLFHQISSALTYAHEQGIVHRDIKPSNILLPRPDWALLTDFGLARMVGGSMLTQSGITVGTPAYMSPEQGSGEKVDHRTDIYALGIMLYEMVVGEVPYTAETPMAVVVKHIVDPLPMPRTKNPNIPEALQRVILKALAKKPDDRFQSAAELSEALRQVANLYPDWSSAEMKAVNAVHQPPLDKENLRNARAEAPTLPPTNMPTTVEPANDPTEAQSAAIQPRPKKKRRWPLIIGGLFILLICALAGLAGLQAIANRRSEIQPTNTFAPPVVQESVPEELIQEYSGDPDTDIQRVTDLINQGDFERARILTETILRRNPQLWGAFMDTVNVLIVRGNLDQAIKLLQVGLEANPEAHPEEMALAGWLLVQADRPGEALPAFEQAIRIDPGMVEAYDGLVYTAIQTEQIPKEIQFLNSLAQDVPEEPLVFRSLGNLYLGTNEMQEAINAYEQALAVNPNDPETLIKAYYPYLVLGQKNRALEMVNQAVEAAPDNPDILGQAGDAFLNIGIADRALETYTRAFELDDQNGYYALGQARAVDALNRGIERLPEMLQTAERLGTEQSDPWLLSQIGWFYIKIDQCEPAVRLFTLAEEIAPGETDARDGLDQCR